LKDTFQENLKDKSKVFCKYCNKGYKPRPCDLVAHMVTKKHTDAKEKKKDSQETLVKHSEGKEIARAEIIWAFFLSATRNLSSNLSDFASVYLKQMFLDSRIGKKFVVNRKKKVLN